MSQSLKDPIPAGSATNGESRVVSPSPFSFVGQPVVQAGALQNRNIHHTFSFLLQTENGTLCLMLVDEHSAHAAREELLAAIADERFPCVGAKSAMASGTLRTLVFRALHNAQDDERIHSELLDWVALYRNDPTGLRSLAVVFTGPHDLTEKEFEATLWERLQSLTEIDERRGQAYDPDVSPDPDNANFSLSFGGAAFFVIGLHPNASRPARRLPRPALIFNLHDQFERLREKGRYERMREKILERDLAYAGSINPMLARFGETSEARQYSGRVVGNEWRCPFRGRRNT